MINNVAFSTRLKEIMEFYDLSSSAFADQIGVQRSSISHLLSGRNKPSLDFVLKVTNAFKEIDLYWLINGKGDFPNTKKKEQQNISINPPIEKATYSNSGIGSTQTSEKKIAKVVVFYSDGTFEEFQK